MSYYGRKYKSSEEKRANKKASKAKHRKARAESRKKWLVKTKALIFKLRDAMDRAGLKQIEMADFSGLDAATLIKNRRHRNMGIRLSTFVAIANACGYDVKLVKKSPSEDEFRRYRVVRLSDLDDEQD